MATRKTKIITKTDKLKLNAKDIGIRAAKTFLQTLLASVGVIIAATDVTERNSLIVSALAGAGASAISVVQNALLAVRDK